MKERDYVQRQLGPSPSSILKKFESALSGDKKLDGGGDRQQDTMKLLRDRVSLKNVCK